MYWGQSYDCCGRKSKWTGYSQPICIVERNVNNILAERNQLDYMTNQLRNDSWRWGIIHGLNLGRANGYGPINHAVIPPRIHPRVDGVPAAEPFRQAAFATAAVPIT